jgi:putative oxidoreductase
MTLLLLILLGSQIVECESGGMAMSFLSPYSGILLSVLRFMSGLLLLQHGTTKYLGVPVGPMNNASPMTMSGAAGVIELVFGALLVIGLFTRLSAFIVSGMTAVAYFYAHAARSFYPILNGGELAVLYCFVFLYIAAAGPGPLSVDRLLGRE